MPTIAQPEVATVIAAVVPVAVAPDYTKTTLKIGEHVLLGKHSKINGKSSWTKPMEDFVGKHAFVTQVLPPTEPPGENGIVCVKVDIDKGQFFWRAHDCVVVPIAAKTGRQYACLEANTYNKIAIDLMKLTTYNRDVPVFMTGAGKRVNPIVLSSTDLGELKKVGFKVDDGEAIATNVVYYDVGKCTNKEIDDAATKVIMDEMIRIFIDFSAKRRTSLLKTTTEKRDALKANEKSYRESMLKAMREIMAHEEAIVIFEKSGEIFTDHCRKDLSAVLAIQKVKSLTAVENLMSIFTKTLYCSDVLTGVEHEIGEMQFDVNFGTGTIKILNLTRRIDSSQAQMNAPHVASSGDPCWGNIATTINELIAEYNVSALVSLIIQFVETVNQGNGHEYGINKWPKSTRTTEAVNAATPVLVNAKEGTVVSSTRKKRKR